MTFENGCSVEAALKLAISLLVHAHPPIQVCCSVLQRVLHCVQMCCSVLQCDVAVFVLVHAHHNI